MKMVTAILGLESSFFSASSVIFAGSFVVNVLNYIFTLVMSRLMEVEAFGEVAALLSLFLVITVPATAVAMLMSREAAFRTVAGDSSVRDLFLYLQRHVLLAAFFCWLVFLGVLPLLSELLHIPYLPFLVFSALVPLTLIGALQSGTLQGLQEFFMLSKQGVLATLVKLVAAIALVLAGLSVFGVMVALVLASCAGLVYGYFATRRVLGIEEGMPRPSLDGREVRALFSSIFFTTLLVALLSNVDVLLAKHYLSPELAGHYGALSSVGKILIYGVGAFVTVLLPLASAARARGSGAERSVLALSLSAIAAASFSAWALFSLYPSLVVSMLFGARYLDIAPYLGTFTIAMGSIALSLALINYFVAVRNTSFMYALALGIVAEVVLIVGSHDSLAAITEMLVIASLSLLVLLGLNYFFTQTRASMSNRV